MIDKELLDILACPETKEPVHLADQSLIDSLNARIEKGEVVNRNGTQLEKKIDGLLLVSDTSSLYAAPSKSIFFLLKFFIFSFIKSIVENIILLLIFIEIFVIGKLNFFLKIYFPEKFMKSGSFVRQ